MISSLKAFACAFKVQLASSMAYRFDFLISSILIFIGELLLPFVTFLIYQSGSSFPGWTLYEALLLQGIFLLSQGIVKVLFSGVIHNTLGRVREGTFDLLLIRPRNTLFLTIITGFDINTFGSLVSGSTIFIIALNKVLISKSIHIIYFVVMMIISILVLFAFNIISAAIVFKWVGNSRIYELFDCVTRFGMYPKSIFSKSIQTLISFVIPISAIGFYPASVLLGQEISGILLSSLVAVLFFGFSLIFWCFMLRKYTSAGG